MCIYCVFTPLQQYSDYLHKFLGIGGSSKTKPELHFEKSGLSLKGLGHAILGNFSTDQMVIELTKI